MSSTATAEDTRPDPDDSLGVLVASHAGEVLATLGIAAEAALATAALAASAQLGDDPHHDAGRLFECSPPAAAGEPVRRFIAMRLQDRARQVILLRPAGRDAALFDFIGAVPFAGAILDHFITNPYQAITVADRAGHMRFISPVHERFLGLRTGEGTGRPAGQVIPNSRLAQVAASGKAEIGQLQTMNGVTRVVNRIPISAGGEVVGAIGQILFKEPEAIGRMHREMTRLRSQLAQTRRALDELREQQAGPGLLIGDSAPMQRLRREIDTVARLDVPVLILGESGTGKELVARAIHGASRAAEGKPLVSLNLAALPATLIESELFGHVAGAFTGSQRGGQAGKLEQAAGGTLFLDEVADIPMEMQVKLLRVLEDHMVERLGSRQSQRVDFRLVAATNRDIQALIDGGRFRLDLYYRLSGVVLRIPALGQRREDIPALLAHFVRGFCARNQVAVPEVGPEVARYLAERRWPGNVRQLRQKIEEALVFCDSRVLRAADFARGEENMAAFSVSEPALTFGAVPEDMPEATPDEGATDAAVASPADLREVAHEAVLQAIARHGGNKKRAAAQLGISRSHLYKILERGPRG
ncbi:sigma 54-interacting transcriptional regulator [Cupriavidus basilensis]|uniref:Sigma 54-interacting transcriptional regulator n=1 Tax=Cupriavidus basilensis TaxID=68895 RepID=A0ABT6AMX5_9BURK|nr:sigma 54-interacting transcriptional regulator [Cupriavidus basilensis]MDF3833784.1 sigma 54-interacting transcriptional regulator [Cupriavidus basilensis]